MELREARLAIFPPTSLPLRLKVFQPWALLHPSCLLLFQHPSTIPTLLWFQGKILEAISRYRVMQQKTSQNRQQRTFFINSFQNDPKNWSTLVVFVGRYAGRLTSHKFVPKWISWEDFWGEAYNSWKWSVWQTLRMYTDYQPVRIVMVHNP